MSFSNSFKAVVEEWLTQQKDAVIPRSKEFNDSGMTFYIRAGRRWNTAQGEIERAVSISRVAVSPVSQNKGVFTEFRLWMEDAALRMAYNAVYVDQVHSEILQATLPRHGYVRDRSTDPMEHIYRKAVGPDAIAETEPVEDCDGYVIYDGANKTYITALVGPSIRSHQEIHKAMVIKGRALAHEVRDSLRGPQSTRYHVVQIEGEE